jgi:hypothetical protein
VFFSMTISFRTPTSGRSYRRFEGTPRAAVITRVSVAIGAYDTAETIAGCLEALRSDSFIDAVQSDSPR